MAFGHECEPGLAVPSSNVVGARAVIGSQPDSASHRRGRTYRSLRGYGRFGRAYEMGRRRRCGPISVVVAPGEPGPPQVGFVAARKVGSAVDRNRAKRRMRAAASCVPLKSDTVYVIVADRGVLTADFERLVRWIRRCSSSSDAAQENEWN
jgi:ribonuclease P protein component